MTFTKTNKYWGIAAATLTVAGSLLAPQAMAGSKAELGNSKVQALESQVNEMADMLRSMQSELDNVKNQPAPVAAALPEIEKKPESMVFFRGGYALMDHRRDDLLTGNQFGGNVIENVLGGGKTNKDGWYVGAGFDFGLTDDVWGLMDDTSVLAEIMFEYKNFKARDFKNNPAIIAAGNNTADPGVNVTTQTDPLCTLIQYASSDELQSAFAGTNGLANGAGTANCNSVQVSQFTLSASPKFKFMKGSFFRPWIIPIGLAVHVISPPSNGVTVLNPGMMFAGGAEIDVWKAIKIGADVRYHLAPNIDGVSLNGLTAGGYLGIGF